MENGVQSELRSVVRENDAIFNRKGNVPHETASSDGF